MIKDFLFTYWREILYIVCAIISLVCCCVRKKSNKVVDGIVDHIFTILPQIINQAEGTDLKGQDKLDYATGLVLNYLKFNTGLDEKTLYAYVDLIHGCIENILTTPQKKER